VYLERSACHGESFCGCEAADFLGAAGDRDQEFRSRIVDGHIIGRAGDLTGAPICRVAPVATRPDPADGGQQGAGFERFQTQVSGAEAAGVPTGRFSRLAAVRLASRNATVYGRLRHGRLSF